MQVRTFAGGIYLFRNKPGILRDLPKTDSRPSSSIKTMPYPQRVVLPLHYTNGSSPMAERNLLVKVGDYLERGTKIAEGENTLPLYTPISGEVKALVPWLYPSGEEILSVIIESQGKIQFEKKISLNSHWSEMTFQELSEIIFQAGIADFRKIRRHQIETLLVNGIDEDYWDSSNSQLLGEKAKEIIEGTKILLHLFGAWRARLIIQDNKKENIIKLKNLLRDEMNIAMVLVRPKYPQREKRLLIKSVFGKEFSVEELPENYGISVQDIKLIFYIYEAVRNGKPLMENIIGVNGSGVTNSQNIKVSLGTLFSEIIKFCGGWKEKPGKLIINGLIKGQAIPAEEMPLTSNVNVISLLSAEEVEIFSAQHCLRCSRCAEACPLRLLPGELAVLIQHSRFEEAQKKGLLECFECGACAYVCPSKINLLHCFHYGKRTPYETHRGDAESAE
ncbi:MAG: RnfABCDGE type electron transport complex subunit C [Candidatus Edwardsbacteria bacterium]